jgi:hypothetical protein
MKHVMLSGQVGLLLAVFAACGGGSATDEPDAFQPATHENAFLMRQVHGYIGTDERDVPIQAMRPTFWTRAKPLGRDDDVPYDTFGIGCITNTWDLESDDLPNFGDMGTVVVSGYSGRGGGGDGLSIPDTLSCELTRPNAYTPYTCADLPEMFIEGPIDDLTPASVLVEGDRVTFAVSGGPATRDASFSRLTDGHPPGLTVVSPELSGTNAIDMNSDLNIVVNCEDRPRCGTMNAAAFVISDNPDPFGPPIRYYSEIACSYLADSDTIVVPAKHLQFVDNTPWESMYIEVMRMGFPVGIFPEGAATIGVGRFFVNLRQ